jgi:hypothetical protein
VLALKRITSGLIASAVTASMLIATAPTSGAAIAPAPRLPNPPGVSASNENTNISVPVISDLAKGTWVTYGPVGGAAAKFTVKMPVLQTQWCGDFGSSSVQNKCLYIMRVLGAVSWTRS